MRRFILSCLIAGFAAPALAHHPERECQPVRRRIEVIPPLDSRLPISYRRRYNRPRYHGGKIAYYIAPSSQEAMRWHEAEHRGYYENDAPRMVTHYFYPKPWEAIKVGPRPAPADDEGLLEPTPDVNVDSVNRPEVDSEILDLRPESEELPGGPDTQIDQGLRGEKPETVEEAKQELREAVETLDEPVDRALELPKEETSLDDPNMIE